MPGNSELTWLMTDTPRIGAEQWAHMVNEWYPQDRCWYSDQVMTIFRCADWLILFDKRGGTRKPLQRKHNHYCNMTSVVIEITAHTSMHSLSLWVCEMRFLQNSYFQLLRIMKEEALLEKVGLVRLVQVTQETPCTTKRRPKTREEKGREPHHYQVPCSRNLPHTANSANKREVKSES